MILNIPFVELNKFRVSAVTLFCDAVLDYCEHYGIPVEFYPVCEAKTPAFMPGMKRA